MSKEIREQINRIKNLKQILNEDISNKKYYGIFNVYGEYNNGIPLYLITNTKEEMIEKLNHYMATNIPIKNQYEYTINDLDDDHRMYMGKKLPHYINDDWSMVTDDEGVFKSDLIDIKNSTKVDPKEYVM